MFLWKQTKVKVDLGLVILGWRHFDDDQVTKMDEESVVSSFAYVLVYRMRDIAQAMKLETPFPNLAVPGVGDMKQDKATGTTKFVSRQLSGEFMSKDRPKSSGRASGGENEARLIKRSNSAEFTKRRRSSDQQNSAAEATREEQGYSEILCERLPEESFYDNVFDDVESVGKTNNGDVKQNLSKAILNPTEAEDLPGSFQEDELKEGFAGMQLSSDTAAKEQQDDAQASHLSRDPVGSESGFAFGKHGHSEFSDGLQDERSCLIPSFVNINDITENELD